MTLEDAFGTTLRELRVKKEFSQESLALESDLDRTFISLLERGLRQPSLGTIFKLSKALDLHPYELIKIISEKIDDKQQVN